MRDTFTRRDKLVIAAKDVASFLPKLGLVKKPRFHPNGVSFIVPVKDEQAWIKPCIQSIEGVADEIIVVDSSVVDKTTEIVASMAENNPKIKHIRFFWNGSNAFTLSLHIGLVSANYRWVFKWDSDHVAKSTEALKKWIDRANSLDKNRYHTIDLPRVNLDGDLNHQPKDLPFGAYEARLFIWSPELRWTLNANNYERVQGDSIWGTRFPPWYQLHRWHEPYVFHCNIKNPRRMVTKKFQADFMLHKAQFASLDDYAEYRVRNEWHMSMEEAEVKVMDEIKKNLVPYDKQRFGELPAVLKGYVPF